MSTGNLFVISGPSGAGKGTLVAQLMSRMDDAWLSVSATTRTPRPGEIDGVTYFFKTRDEFESMIEANELLEWAEYSGNYYGTPLASIREAMAAGKQVILEIEVQGAAQVKEKLPEAHLIFIEPPSMEELAHRLRTRGTEDEKTIERRLEAAHMELSRKQEYDVTLVNDNLEQATDELVAYVKAQSEK